MEQLQTKIKQSLQNLEHYLDDEGLKGFDPYDALNSKMLSRLSFNNKYLKIAYTQGLKRLPINLRSLLGINKEYNPKGLGLFLSGYVKLYALTKSNKYLQKIKQIMSILEELKSDSYSGHCWGYNFDWQSRAGFTPKDTPTIVNTVFIAHAYLDAYELIGEKSYLRIARSSSDFILNDLNIMNIHNYTCFSYTPLDHSKVYNANMLAAGLLARLYSFTEEKHLLEISKRTAGYVVNKQQPDGSWHYADSNFQQWIDSHHTGFILESLSDYIAFSDDESYKSNLLKGLEYYKNNFFLATGHPKFFHHKLYPIDIHCPAQAIVTFIKLKNNKLILEKIVRWMIDNMQDKRGYFYYRKGRFFYNKIPYIRWSQAWAFHALTTYLFQQQNSTDKKF